MSRYVDIDTLKIPSEEMVAKWIVNSAPSIEIIRCGECMHNGSHDTDCPFGWRDGEWNMPKPCDFCSYGEREGE